MPLAAESKCIFCQIIEHSAPAQIAYQDDEVTAFENLHHLAPVHLLIVPNRHIDSLNQVRREDEAVLGRLFTLASQLAVERGIDQSGYRVVVNTGPDGGQSVFHVHLHLLGGRKLPLYYFV